MGGGQRLKTQLSWPKRLPRKSRSTPHSLGIRRNDWLGRTDSSNDRTELVKWRTCARARSVGFEIAHCSEFPLELVRKLSHHS